MKIKNLVANHFLSEFNSTKVISRYSPTALEIAKQSSGSYWIDVGGFCEITADHVLDAAIQLGIPIGFLKGKDIRIGISAKQFNLRKAKFIFSSKLICEHGHVPIRFTLDERSNELVEVPSCPKCVNGMMSPSDEAVKDAIHWIQTSKSLQPIGAGALIMAARHLDAQVIKDLNGTFQISMKKKGGS